MLKRISSALAEASQPSTPRLRQLMTRANGILADPSTPGAYSADVLNDRDGDQWPLNTHSSTSNTANGCADDAASTTPSRSCALRSRYSTR
jgi:hypothetical protein